VTTYSEDILRLAETSITPLGESEPRAEMANRLCGDRISIGAVITDEIIDELHWQVEGCVILKASAAFIARSLKGKTTAHSLNLIAAFMRSFEANSHDEHVGPMAAIYRLPARYKCALLPWQACENFLRENR
jgi:nitrogen fixation protein NifU and related proteins